MFGISKPSEPPKDRTRKAKAPAKQGARESGELVSVSLKMLPAQRDKLARLGGAEWVRTRIDAAPDRDAD